MNNQGKSVNINLFRVLDILCDNEKEAMFMYYLIINNTHNEVSETYNKICKNTFMSISTLNRIIKALKNRHWIKINTIFKDNKKSSKIKILNKFYRDFNRISNRIKLSFPDSINTKETQIISPDNTKKAYVKTPDNQYVIKINPQIIIEMINKIYDLYLKQELTIFQIEKIIQIINYSPQNSIRKKSKNYSTESSKTQEDLIDYLLNFINFN